MSYYNAELAIHNLEARNCASNGRFRNISHDEQEIKNFKESLGYDCDDEDDD